MKSWYDLYSDLKKLIDEKNIVDITQLVTYKLGYSSNHITLAIGTLKNEGCTIVHKTDPTQKDGAFDSFYICSKISNKLNFDNAAVFENSQE